MNPSAPSFKPAGGLPTPAIEGPIAAGTTAVDASLAIVPPRERQVGVVDHRVTSEALARLEAMNHLCLLTVCQLPPPLIAMKLCRMGLL